MTFSQYAGVAIVPTLSRIVLAATFLFTGYMKVMVPAEFEATADGTGPANQLSQLEVSLTPVSQATGSVSWGGSQDGSVQLVALRQAATEKETVATPPAATPPAPAVPAASPAGAESPAMKPNDAPTTTKSDTPPANAPATTADAKAPASTLPVPTLTPGKYKALSLHYITLMVREKTQWPQPVMLAWAAALTELVGGALLAIGLFSRLCGLALATVMGVAFYLTSLPVLQSTPLLQIPPMQMTGIFVQASLFVLALGILLTGPGPLSVDRLLFSRPEMPPVDEKKQPASNARH